MAVRDRDFDRDAKTARKVIAFPLDDVGNNVADGKRGAFKPGYSFEIVDVQHFIRDITATITYTVKIGTTAALASAVTPVDATQANATLAASVTARRGGPSDVINLHVTTDGTGAAEEGCVYVTIRPRPLRGE